MHVSETCMGSENVPQMHKRKKDDMEQSIMRRSCINYFKYFYFPCMFHKRECLIPVPETRLGSKNIHLKNPRFFRIEKNNSTLKIPVSETCLGSKNV